MCTGFDEPMTLTGGTLSSESGCGKFLGNFSYSYTYLVILLLSGISDTWCVFFPLLPLPISEAGQPEIGQFIFHIAWIISVFCFLNDNRYFHIILIFWKEGERQYTVGLFALKSQNLGRREIPRLSYFLFPSLQIRIINGDSLFFNTLLL